MMTTVTQAYTRSSYSSYSYYSDYSDTEYDSRDERDRSRRVGDEGGHGHVNKDSFSRRSPREKANYTTTTSIINIMENPSPQKIREALTAEVIMQGHHRGDDSKTPQQQSNSPEPHYTLTDAKKESPQDELHTGITSTESSITMGDMPTMEPSRQALGGGWERIDEGDTTFYYNAATNEVHESSTTMIL